MVESPHPVLDKRFKVLDVARLLLGSVADKVIRGAVTPVLV